MDKFKLSKYDWVTFPMFLSLIAIIGIPFIVTCVYVGMLIAYKLFG